MTRRPRLAPALLALWLLAAPGCVVLSLDRYYDDASIAFDDRLLGSWKNVDDNTTVTIERSEWRSYRITYVHPVEKGTLTGYLFQQGRAMYMDLSPVRGQDLGSFALPAHALVKVTIAPGRFTAAPLSMDWFSRGLTARTLPATLAATRDERDHVILAGPRAALQRWLAARAAADPAFGAEAVFIPASPSPPRP